MNNDKYSDFTAGANDDGKRIDRIIRQFIKEQNLASIYKAFRKGMIRIEGRKASPDEKIAVGDTISIYKALLKKSPEVENPKEIKESGLKNSIIYEDDDLLALNKKRGDLVHGGKDSLEEEVRRYLKNRIPPSLSFTPGPLHRLDRNTSGLIFFSKSIQGARLFSKELHDGNFKKFYLALLDGILGDMQLWTDTLIRNEGNKKTEIAAEGKRAVTTVKPVISGSGKTLAFIRIETGRTHQIRAQASFHGFPLSGDGKYGGSHLKGGYFLHSLSISHKTGNYPGSGKSVVADLNAMQLESLCRIFKSCAGDDLKKKIFGIMEEK